MITRIILASCLIPLFAAAQDKGTPASGCGGFGVGIGGNSSGHFYILVLGCSLEKLKSRLSGPVFDDADDELVVQLETALAVLESLEYKQRTWIEDLERSWKNHEDLVAMQTAGQGIDDFAAGHNAQVNRHADNIAKESQALDDQMARIGTLQKQLEMRANGDDYYYQDTVIEILASLAKYREQLDDMEGNYRQLTLESKTSG